MKRGGRRIRDQVARLADIVGCVASMQHCRWWWCVLVAWGFALQMDATETTSSASSAPDLSGWIGSLLPIMGNASALDLRLPGTHDTLTYDLSSTIADGCVDDHPELSNILHWLSDAGVVPSFISGFIHGQAQTQALTVTEQLDNGIRALDLRAMYQGPSKGWMSLHFLQSNRPFTDYLREIRTWLDAHPSELVAIEMTRHGMECSSDPIQWPGVAIEPRRALWNEIKSVFQGLLFNSSQHDLATTPVRDLIAANQRVLFMVASSANFTGSDPLALDTCVNTASTGDGGVWPYKSKLSTDASVYANSGSTNAQRKASRKFFADCTNCLLPGGATSYKVVAESLFLPFAAGRAAAARKCAAEFGIPNMTEWCPGTILDLSQQCNYYRQRPLEQAWQEGWDLPHILLMDAVDQGGMIRTGTRPVSVDGTGVNVSSSRMIMGGGQHETTGYAYVDLVLAINIRNFCRPGAPHHGSLAADCDGLASAVQARRNQAPLMRWSDPQTGRLEAWPA